MASTETVDGVERYPKTGIKVIIAGGGVGGLGAALECWRKGHDPIVIERMKDWSSIGDAFGIGPSALATLHHYPSMFADYHTKVFDMKICLVSPAGKILGSVYPEWKRPGSSEHCASKADVGFSISRPAFHRMQVDQVERLGIPIEYGKFVEDAIEDEATGKVTVHTKDGSRYEGDVLIDASGIGSKLHKIRGTDIIKETGYAIARVAFTAKDLKPGSKAWELIPKDGQPPEFRVYLAKDRWIVMFLTQDFLAITATHPDLGDASESWHHEVDSAEAVRQLKSRGDWDPAVIDFVEQIPKKIIDWKLSWRNPNPNWVSPGGLIVQLGDAAHSFLPTSGNGATQALEDGLSLAECLRIGGKGGIPLALAVHNKLRFQRVSVLQRVGFVNKEFFFHADVRAMEEHPEKAKLVMGRWVWGHNAEAYATEQWEAAVACVRDGADFHNTNLPPGYVYEPWTMEGEMERDAKGIPSPLKTQGDWSA